MRIPVDGIPAAGRLVEFSVRDTWAANAAQSSLDHEPEAVEGSMLLTVASKRKGLVRVEGKVRATRPANCDRCGEVCTLEIEEPFSLLYGPEEAGGASFDGGELELAADDLDLGWYRNAEIALGDVLREALALALPTRVVCADRAECDKRTHLMLAAHAADPGHPAFAALSGLRTGGDDGG